MMNQPCLILLGGAPGVGKSAVASLLLKRLENSVWLDGDDLWRMNPFTVTESRKRMVLKNISLVLSSFLGETFEYVILSWVMHEPGIAAQILSGLYTRRFRLFHFTLSCSEQTLLERIAGAGTERDSGLCLDRLRSARQNYPDLLDTEGLSAERVVEIVFRVVSSAFSGD